MFNGPRVAHPWSGRSMPVFLNIYTCMAHLFLFDCLRAWEWCMYWWSTRSRKWWVSGCFCLIVFGHENAACIGELRAAGSGESMDVSVWLSSGVRMVHVLVSYEDKKVMTQRLRHDESRGIVSWRASASVELWICANACVLVHALVLGLVVFQALS